MDSQLVHSGKQHTHVVVMDADDEAVECLTRFAREAGLDAAGLTAIGGFSHATLGYFDRAEKTYQEIPVHEQVEVLSLVGDIALADGEPRLHAHVVLGRRDGSTVGGHLLEGRVWPTLEVVVEESPGHLVRRTDADTGLALIQLTPDS